MPRKFLSTETRRSLFSKVSIHLLEVRFQSYVNQFSLPSGSAALRLNCFTSMPFLFLHSHVLERSSSSLLRKSYFKHANKLFKMSFPKRTLLTHIMNLETR